MIVALPGDLGKPRPAVIVQSDDYGHTASVVILPITSTIVDGSFIRVVVVPDGQNGLREISQVMTDKITSTPRTRVGQVIGVLDPKNLSDIEARLARLLGLA